MGWFSSVAKLRKVNRVGETAFKFTSTAETTKRFRGALHSADEAKLARETNIQEKMLQKEGVDVYQANEIASTKFTDSVGADRLFEIRRDAQAKYGINLDNVDDKYLPGLDAELTHLSEALQLPSKGLSFGDRLVIKVKDDVHNKELLDANHKDLARAEGYMTPNTASEPNITGTKKSLAHEWFHNLDQYFDALDTGHIELRGNRVIYNPKVKTSFVTDKGNLFEGNGISKGVADTWRTINEVIKKHSRQVSGRLPANTKKKSRKYLTQKSEVAARSFEKWLYTVKLPNPAKFKEYEKSYYPTDYEIKELAPLFDKLFNEMNSMKALDVGKGNKEVIHLYGSGGTAVLGNISIPKEDKKEKGG